MNIVGNVAGGRFLQHGVAPERLLRWGFASMALGSVAAFAQVGQAADAASLPPALRYVAVCMFSLGGGMVPATLFMLGGPARARAVHRVDHGRPDAAGLVARAVHRAAGGRVDRAPHRWLAMDLGRDPGVFAGAAWPWWPGSRPARPRTDTA